MNMNTSTFSSVLTLESFAISPAGVYPVFFFGTVTYCMILFFNITIIIIIALNKKLHKPMYLLLFSLPVNDMMGATAFFPQQLLSILSESRFIPYPACFFQALLVHMYATGSLIILTAMAYDRYVAICHPLRYNTIMTNNTVVRMTIAMWLIDFALVVVMLFLLTSFAICRTLIVDTYCNNASLMKLICEDVSRNNYYGLVLTALYQGVSLIVVVFTYLQILLTCLTNKQSDAKSKAIQTCATHLVVFIFLELNAFIAIISHRLEKVPPDIRRGLGASVFVFPPILNPLIYGIRTKEIREKIQLFFNNKVATLAINGKRPVT